MILLDTERPICIECDRPAANKGNGKFHLRCKRHHGVKYGTWGYTKQEYERGGQCERCGFVPEHSCQLDVDHKDGNKANNTPANLQTLCANCHRLKGMLNGDYLTQGGKIGR